MEQQQRRTLFCANWKMNLFAKEASRLATNVRQAFQQDTDPLSAEVILAPSFSALVPVAAAIKDSPIQLGAQTCGTQKRGAFTGEVSAWDLAEIGCTYVIVGHSERRRLFGETNHLIAEKVAAAFDAGLSVILCIGEPEPSPMTTDRIPPQVRSVLTEQLQSALSKSNLAACTNLVVAYEPVWAIGSGNVATAAWAQSVHHAIRQVLRSQWGPISSSIRIVYGGSFTAAQVKDFLAQPDIDGALVGTASLTLSSFLDILGAPKEKTR